MKQGNSWEGLSSNWMGILIGALSSFGLLQIFLLNKHYSADTRQAAQQLTDRKQVQKTQSTIDVNLAEYAAVRKEIDLMIELENRVVNYGVLIIGGLVAFQTLFSQEIILLLVASMLFSSLTWALAEAEVKIHDMGNYLRNDLFPRLQELIDTSNENKYQVMRWSIYRNQNKFRILLRGFTGIGKFLITFIPGILLVVMYYFSNSINISAWDTLDRVLFYAAVGMILIIPTVLLLNLASNLYLAFRRKDWRKYFPRKLR